MQTLFPCTISQSGVGVRPASLEKQLDGACVILISSPYMNGGDRLVKQVKGGMEECDQVKGICSLVSLTINNWASWGVVIGRGDNLKVTAESIDSCSSREKHSKTRAFTAMQRRVTFRLSQFVRALSDSTV
jgi:hypothetical protein